MYYTGTLYMYMYVEFTHVTFELHPRRLLSTDVTSNFRLYAHALTARAKLPVRP